MTNTLGIRRSSLISHSLIYLILTVGMLIMIFPLVWTISTSLKAADQISLRELVLIPNPVVWYNYIEIFQVQPMVLYFRNTMTIVVAAWVGVLITSSMAAYAFAQIRFPGRDFFFILLLSTMMLPYVVRLIPLYVMFDQMNLINTLWPLMIPRMMGHDAFFIFLMRQFYRGIPKDLFDAARIDGCSELGVWWRIVMPISKPVLATVAIFSFQNVWNDFLFPLIYLGGNKANWTLALGLNSMKGFEGETPLHLMMVFSVLMIIPLLIVFGFGQKYIVQGANTSGLKG